MDYDTWLDKEREATDPKTLYYCSKCQEEIYEGCEYFETENYPFLCEDCMDQELAEYKEDCRRIARKNDENEWEE